uniref:NADAR domain-containing protein n=1 Tax=Romanomermis culicivorax TaxID=13658 RepID=A0A915JWG3_ROMCU
MQKACRKCMIFGHTAKECNVTPIAPPKGSYAAAVTKPKSMAPAPSSTAAAPPPTTASLAEVLPFYSKSDFESNHFPCKFKDEKGTDYNSTEQFLFFKKAVQAGDLARAKDIMQAKEAKQAKWIGEKVSWDEKKLGTWPKFAYNQLFKANTLKYEQNKDLREALFKTSPAILVEASPYDKNWGVGLAKDHPDIKDPSKWQGQNWFGNLLTKLRNEMMAYYVEETTSSVSSTVLKKRPLDNPSPQQQPLKHRTLSN